MGEIIMPPGRPKKNAEEKVVVNDDYLDSSFILGNPKKIISMGPAKDMILSGGIPESTICLLESAPKIGKTTLALQAVANGQKQHGKIGVYVSVENRLSQKNLQGVDGLDISPDMFKIISSQKGEILSAEQILTKAEKALIDFPGCVMVFDSFSSLSSSAERTGNYGEGFGNVSARKMEGEFARRISPIIQVNDNIVIGIAHITPNLNMPGNSVKVSKAILYQMDIRLSMKKVYPQGDWMAGDRLIGQKVNIECITSALGAPGMSCVGWLKYGHGFSNEAELVQLAIDLSLIEKKGAGWMEVSKFGEKAQGMDNMISLLENRPDIYNYLNDEVKEILK